MDIKINKETVEINSKKEEKSFYVKKMFSSIAPKYDFFNDLISFGMHRNWKNFVLKLANFQEGNIALDVCTGTGDIALRLAKKVKNNSKVIGVDFVLEMLEIATLKTKKQKLDNILTFQQGDILDLPFEDNTFDVITVGYGLRNVTDIPKAIAEMKRVAKDGGRIISLDLGKPKLPIYKDIYYFYFYKIMPFLTSLFQSKKEAYNYLPNSLNEFPAQEGLIKIMQETGLKDVKCYEFALGSTAIHFGIK